MTDYDVLPGLNTPGGLILWGGLLICFGSACIVWVGFPLVWKIEGPRFPQ